MHVYMKVCNLIHLSFPHTATEKQGGHREDQTISTLDHDVLLVGAT